jgi:isopentenyl-diphosphate Delta-isomerase
MMTGCPGKWTVSCSGHIRAGELPEIACRRELREELGIEAPSPSYLFKELLPKIIWASSTEYEIAYAYECHYNSDITPDTQEVESVRFVSTDGIKVIVEKNSSDFTPDALILLKKYLQRAERR